MNKITSLFSIAGLLALTACTVDPVTDVNAMEEAVLARQNELAAQSTTNSTYSEESENESDEDDDDAQSGGENEGYEGSAEGDSSNDESGEAEGAEQNEQNEQNEQDEAADQSDNSGTQEGDADQAADGDTEQESASSGGNASESNDDDSSAQQTTGGVPSGVAATAWTAIQSYISQHFNAASVVEVEQEDGEIEVKLNSGHEVYFTLSGNYIRTEN